MADSTPPPEAPPPAPAPVPAAAPTEITIRLRQQEPAGEHSLTVQSDVRLSPRSLVPEPDCFPRGAQVELSVETILKACVPLNLSRLVPETLELPRLFPVRMLKSG
jgi:hypothetical protein